MALINPNSKKFKKLMARLYGIGAAIVMQILPILPYALAFSAGAMIFIVVEEVIPESQSGGNTDLATMGLIAGFIVMMILDVSLG